MKHLKVCIILLSFILFLTCFLLSDVEAMDNNNVITVKQLAKLSSVLVDPTEETADTIIKYVTGLRLNNPFFTSILRDKYLTNYGKCIFLKEINDFVISNSVTQNDKVKNSFKQAVISNARETVKDDIIIEKATLIDDILDGTMPDNADKTINAINGLNLEDTIIKSIIDIYELSDYNKVLIIKQIMNSMINNSGVKGDEMDKTWKQSLGVPLETVARKIRTPPHIKTTEPNVPPTTTPYVPTTTPYVPTTTPYVPTTTPYVPTTTPYVPTTTPYVPTTTPYVPTTTPTPIAYYVQHPLTGKYLDLRDNKLSMSDYNSAQSSSQEWMYTGNKELKNKQTNKCLDSNDTTAYVSGCNGESSQKWDQQNNTFKNVKTDKVLDSNGTDVYVRPYNSEDSQQWSTLSSNDAAAAKAKAKAEADAKAKAEADAKAKAEADAKAKARADADAAAKAAEAASAKNASDTAKTNAAMAAAKAPSTAVVSEVTAEVIKAKNAADLASAAATAAENLINAGTEAARTSANAARTSANSAKANADAANNSLNIANANKTRADADAAAADAEAAAKAEVAANARNASDTAKTNAANAAARQGSADAVSAAQKAATDAKNAADLASAAATAAETAANSGTAAARTSATEARTSANDAKKNADAANNSLNTANANKTRADADAKAKADADAKAKADADARAAADAEAKAKAADAASAKGASDTAKTNAETAAKQQGSADAVSAAQRAVTDAKNAADNANNAATAAENLINSGTAAARTSANAARTSANDAKKNADAANNSLNTAILNNTYIPFKAGNQTATPSNEDGGGNVIYFDRHTIECNNNGINQIHLSRPNTKSIQFQYTCTSGGKLGSSNSNTTPANEDGKGNFVYLDRHDANCGNNNIMTKLHLNRPSGNQIQYQYSCAPNNQSQQLNCRNVTSDFQDDGGGNSIYLDRHDIRCNSNEAISRLKLARDSSGKKVQYQYTCCS